MKPNNRLPKFFRRLFTALEVLVILGSLTICTVLLCATLKLRSIAFDLGEIGLVPATDEPALEVKSLNAESITLNRLKGSLTVRGSAEGGLVSTARWYILPLVIGYAAFIIVLFDLLRRLFRQVERGESFSEQTNNLVRMIGMIIILFAVLSAVASSCYTSALVHYLARHATISGAKIAFITPNSNSLISINTGNFEFHFNWSTLLAGLLVLALGEVFRQGLALKKDSDLTI